MKILGIETSCDETAVAVVEEGTKILANVVASSVEMHQKTGGIIPEVAAREQIKWILPVIEKAIRDTQHAIRRKENTCHMSHITCCHIDALAVTIGPGLIGSLLVGVETAKTLAYVWNKPIIPVNHLVAHIYANFIGEIPKFPAIALVVSGGHTDLVLMKDHPSKGRGKLQWIGGTRDDAAGECFDKCARVLGLGYPGGPAIAATAAKYVIRDMRQVARLPRPMIKEDNFDFSFSGLKTAVLRQALYRTVTGQAQDKLSENKKVALAYELQEAITDVLVSKTLRAAEKYQVKSVLLAGGVSANSRLREKMQHVTRDTQYVLYIPKPRLCTDNAAIVATCAYFNYHPLPWKQITTLPGLTITGEV